MKATAEQYFPVVLFVMLYRVVLTFDCMDESMTAQKKVNDFPVVVIK